MCCKVSKTCNSLRKTRISYKLHCSVSSLLCKQLHYSVFVYTHKKGIRNEKIIGDKAFYKMVLLVAVPIMVQNGDYELCQSVRQHHGRTGWNKPDVRSCYCQSAHNGIQSLYLWWSVRRWNFYGTILWQRR